VAPVILWFRRNLRLRDNAALCAAVESGAPIIPVYILDTLDTGGASRWWLHHSLAALDKELHAFGSALVLRSGQPQEELRRLVEESGAAAIYLAQRYEPQARQQEADLLEQLGTQIDIQTFADGHLTCHDSLLTKGGTPFRIFTPYWRVASSGPYPALPLAAPESADFASPGFRSLTLTELGLLPEQPNWAEQFPHHWTPGEEGAMRRLDNIDAAALDYAQQRDRPDLDTTSRLSPHLHFGEISPRQAWHAIHRSAMHLPSARGADALTRQLYWRDFSAYLLYHFPTLAEQPLRSEFAAFPWTDDASRLLAWQQGKTGYPIVDAGMRQLWASGWMHNRVRMIAASFLVKDLLVRWQQGARWFLDTLVDADLANNSASWQWVAGCGTDAAPYFRIFNPTLQGRKFDPNGDYVRRWVPELRALPTRHVHEPWLADHETQAAAGLVIGDNYPEPIVDHGDARQQALAAYRITRGAGSPGPAMSD
jgi:deoxyribodipyrimidine photo-lyase